MRIALCDDDQKAQTLLKELIESYCGKKGLEAEIYSFSSAEEFLSSEAEFTIVFMDVYLTGINGTDAVRTALEKKDFSVVFTTVSREYAVEAFGLNATHYLIKPVTAADASEAMDRCLRRIRKKSEKNLEVKNGSTVIPIPIGSIVYIEVFNKVSVIHTRKNSIQAYAPLDALYEQLDDDCFMRAQRSYIVNMRFIDSFFFDHIVLRDGTEISLSRSNRTKLKNQYQRFLFNLARRGEM